jgi:hypothetical protein
MKARVISDENHLIGQLFKDFFTCTFMSKRTGVDITDPHDIDRLVEDTHNYDWTIIVATGMPFGSANLLTSLQKHCFENKLNHKVFNIGSYVNLILLSWPDTSYDVNKAVTKYLHRKITNEFVFHNGYLDSRLLNLNYIEKLSTHIDHNYPHLHTLKIDDIKRNLDYMLKNDNIKELSLQYNQPGNHRINDGIGHIAPGLF